MYDVLVPVDRDENRALHQAQYVTGFPDATQEVAATVLSVVTPGELDEMSTATFGTNEAAVAAAEHLESAGIAVDRRVEEGRVSETIVRTAEAEESRELVMGGRKRSGVTSVLLGSTVHDVFLSTDRAVTITGTGMVLEDGHRNVLVPVDESRERARHQAEYVAGLPGAPESVEATVLHVFAHQDYNGAPPHEFEDVDAAVEAADHLDDQGITVERTAIGGEVARTIVDTAAERGVHGIVMGGRKRSGVQKVLMGSTAQDVLLSANRPVTITG